MSWAAFSTEENPMFNRLEQQTEAETATQIRQLPDTVKDEAVQIASDERIADYLEQVCGRLLSLSYSERQQIRNELRPHLEAMIAARRELGDTYSEAVTHSLTAFGEPKKVAASFRYAYETTGQERAAPWSSMAAGMKIFSGAAFVTIAVGISLFDVLRLGHVNRLSDTYFLIAVYIIPAIAGWCMGANAKNARPGFGAFCAIAILCGISVPISLLALFFYTPHLFLTTGLVVLNFLMLLWMPIAITAANVAASVTRRRKRFRLV
jgi:hypothetical protein